MNRRGFVIVLGAAALLGLGGVSLAGKGGKPGGGGGGTTLTNPAVLYVGDGPRSKGVRYGEIFLTDFDGAVHQAVGIGSQHFLVRRASWSPDGAAIAFTTMTTAAGGSGPSGGGLYVVDRDGGNLTLLVSGTGGEEVGQWAEWSPDGRRIAYWYWDHSNGNALWLRDTAGGTSEMLLTASVPGDISWSPDTDAASGYQGAIALDGISLLPVEIAEDGTLTAGAPVGLSSPEGDVTGLAPDWSPDGARILYRLSTGTPFQWYTVRVDGTEDPQFVRSGIDDARWSSDGQHFVFTASGAVYRMPVSGGTPVNLTQGRAASRPRWNPAWDPGNS